VALERSPPNMASIHTALVSHPPRLEQSRAKESAYVSRGTGDQAPRHMLVSLLSFAANDLDQVTWCGMQKPCINSGERHQHHPQTSGGPSWPSRESLKPPSSSGRSSSSSGSFEKSRGGAVSA
jgi:hypothetical protein